MSEYTSRELSSRVAREKTFWSREWPAQVLFLHVALVHTGRASKKKESSGKRNFSYIMLGVFFSNGISIMYRPSGGVVVAW